MDRFARYMDLGCFLFLLCSDLKSENVNIPINNSKVIIYFLIASPLAYYQKFLIYFVCVFSAHNVMQNYWSEEKPITRIRHNIEFTV